jgi:hypothetical protein
VGCFWTRLRPKLWGVSGHAPTVLAAPQNALGYERDLSSHGKRTGRMIMRWRADDRKSRRLRERERLASQQPIHLAGCQVLALDIRCVCADHLKDLKPKQHWCPLKQDHPTGHSQLRPAIVVAGKRGVLIDLWLYDCYSVARHNRVRRQKDWHIFCKPHFLAKLAQCL